MSGCAICHSAMARFHTQCLCTAAFPPCFIHYPLMPKLFVPCLRYLVGSFEDFTSLICCLMNTNHDCNSMTWLGVWSLSTKLRDREAEYHIWWDNALVTIPACQPQETQVCLALNLSPLCLGYCLIAIVIHQSSTVFPPWNSRTHCGYMLLHGSILQWISK